MPNFFRTIPFCALCIMSTICPVPLAAQPLNDQAGEGNVNIYNLDRNAGVGGVEISGPIDKAVASKAMDLIRSIRPDVFELTVFLNSQGGDALAAIELGEEVRKQVALTAVDDHGECLGACVLVLAAGVRRIPTPDSVGIRRLSFDPKEFANMSADRANQKRAALLRKVETYLARMGMPKRLFQEMAQSSDKVRLLNASRLKTLGLDGTDPAFEEWERANKPADLHNQTNDGVERMNPPRD